MWLAKTKTVGPYEEVTQMITQFKICCMRGPYDSQNYR